MQHLSSQFTPLISCLCVTEGRPEFMPWLLWCYDRQSWPRRELLIVDSSPQPFLATGREDVRVITVPEGTNVPHKRNLALQHASGEFVAWFDDDDWQHPDRLTISMAALRGGALWAGLNSAWFVDIASRRCQFYAGYNRHLVFNSALFRREIAQGVAFAEGQRRGSDTPWMANLFAKYPGKAVVMKEQNLFFWLCHHANLSNPAHRRRFDEPIERLKALIGKEAWAETDEALNALQERLREHQTQPAISDSEGKQSPTKRPRQTSLKISELPLDQTAPRAAETPETKVAVMVKATVLDAPYLDAMVRHMLAQAHYTFCERLIVVDRSANFSGKYRARPRLDQNALDRILRKLLDDGVVDQVSDVDMSSATVKEILGRYFAERSEHVPTHANTGGPIYATLFGLESVSSDYVLQMDADVFFHTSQESWVQQALELLRNDPSLWLMMTHPGPPVGLPGHSLNGPNARRAVWDASLHLWRFGEATTRYFLCDRRRLRGQLLPIFLSDGCAPLERCISLALQRRSAYRGALGDLKSWHLHAWHHADPFPQWADALVRLVEEGRIPNIQRGQYDLRLDLETVRRQWWPLVESLRVTGAARSFPAQADSLKPVDKTTLAVGSSFESGDTNQEVALSSSKEDGPAPMTVIIPVRDRAGQRLRNALMSLNWQIHKRPAEVVIVSHGSRTEINAELEKICEENHANLLTLGKPLEPWNKSLALNYGIRKSREEIPYLMAMDVDMILAPNFITVVVETLQQHLRTLVLCRAADLPQQVRVPDDPTELQRSFSRLLRSTNLRSRTGCGGIQAAARSFFFDVQGYDEDLLWWGAMDGDMLIRAQLMHLKLAWIENSTVMLHQWHPRKHFALSNAHQIEQARWHWSRNHKLVQQRAGTATRNPQGWGCVAEMTTPLEVAEATR